MKSIITKKTRKAALTAAIRTASQSLSAALGLLFVGGAVASSASLLDWDFAILGGSLLAALVLSLIAGLRAFLSIIGGGGIPKAYTDAEPVPIVPAVEPQSMRG